MQTKTARVIPPAGSEITFAVINSKAFVYQYAILSEQSGAYWQMT